MWPCCWYTSQPGHFSSALALCSILWWRHKYHHCGVGCDTWKITLCVMVGYMVFWAWVVRCTLHVKTITRWTQFGWEDLCHIWVQVPRYMLCTARSFMCLSSDTCAYVQGIATHSYMRHPVTVKRSYLLKGSFERVICCLFLMLFMSVHLCGFCMVKPTIALVLK